MNPWLVGLASIYIEAGKVDRKMQDMIVCVDKTIVSLKKVVLCGWVKVEKDTPLFISANLKKAIIEYNKDKNACDKDTITYTFMVSVSSFRSLKLLFLNGDQEKELVFSCFSMRFQRCKTILKKIRNARKAYGLHTTWKMILCRLQGKVYVQKDSESYETWYKQKELTTDQWKAQRQKKFSYMPLISIVIPVYNTPKQYLEEVVASVIDQSYEHWELILVDGHSTNQETIQTLSSFQDERIVILRLEENKMISNNTNAGLEKVKGAYVGLVDHDDVLTLDALYCMVEKLNEADYDMVYSDEDKINQDGTHLFQPHFKPDFNLDMLRSYNYITHFTILKSSMLRQVGLFDPACDGAQDYDMFLRFANLTSHIGHIPRILYHWRVHEQSTAQDVKAKTYVLDAGKYALSKHLANASYSGRVLDGLFPTSYRIQYELLSQPLVSIIIPNKDHVEDLKKCIDSICERTFYSNYEILIVENNSTEPSIFAYYAQLKKHKHIRILTWESEFNYSAINNFAVRQAKGDVLVLLNNDIEIITGRWIEEMLMYAQRTDIGAVGAKLYYPNNTIQHAGVIVGIGSVAGHSHKYYDRDDDGYFGRLKVVQNMSAVTAACLMVEKRKYEEVSGLDEGYQVAFNDVDFCMKLNEKGYRNLFTPYAEMIHYESLSRGGEDSPEKIARFQSEIQRFEERWGLWLEDPCYNRNLSITKEDFSLRK